MRLYPSMALPIVGVALLGAAQVAKSAPSQPPSVLRCGKSEISANRITRSFARLRDFQRKIFGPSPRAQLKGYVEQVAIPDLLLAERGRQSGLLDSDRIRIQHKLLLEAALTHRIGERLVREAPITDAEVKAYYDAHPELFRTPERIRIFRVLVDSESDANAIIERLQNLPSMDDWRTLVREKSKDKATSERGGDLGFVAEDGTTDIPELEVDRTLYAAVQPIKDGAIAPKPVPEGKRFAVLWRRGSLAARTLELASESARIRQQLILERLDREIQTLIAELRRTHLRDHHPERLKGREFPAPRGFSDGSAAPVSSASAPP